MNQSPPPVHLLLIGAGFTRNWGGWLARELEGDILQRLRDRPQLRKMFQESQSFESVLEELQVERRRDPKHPDYGVAINAILESFRTMNAHLAQCSGIELSATRALNGVANFLGQFDAIFSLNQDLLLEMQYRPEVAIGCRWPSYVYPGIEPAPNPQMMAAETLNLCRAVSVPTSWDQDSQPIFKLHGSVDWYDGESQAVVIGGGKEEAIQRSPVLRRYFEIFNDYLSRPNVRLMIIGYGCADTHVNNVIVRRASAQNNIGIYYVDPNGRDVATKNDPKQFVLPVRSGLGEVPCIGESRRSLTDVFRTDDLEYKKLMRFFE